MTSSLPAVAALSAIAAAAAPVQAQDAGAEPGIVRSYSRPDAPIAGVTRVPAGAELIFFSGAVPAVIDTTASRDEVAAFGDTETQTASVLDQIRQRMEAQGLGLGDVVSMTIYLVGDPSNGGRMDFQGMMRAYNRYFGTDEQPHRPSRSTVQIAGLVAGGMLVEIEVTAARLPTAP